MRLWQQCMIFLARSQSVKNFMQTKAKMSDLSERFVGGRNSGDAAIKAKDLKSYGLACSLFNLGEYVEDEKVIHQTMTELKSVAKNLSDPGLDIHLSVDPTQIGWQIDPQLCQNNVFELSRTIKNLKKSEKQAKNSFLMLDMEDSKVTQSTINLYCRMKQNKLPVAITLQAYLYRTEHDLKKIVSSGGVVRLVKGAFAEGPDIAYTNSEEIDSNFLKMSEIMLSQDAAKSAFYPIFGTHDDRMISEIIKLARRNGWEKGQYEIEMLYGVRPDYQKKLIQSGESVRLYLPFGTDWWPYAVRRVGESSKNLKFLINVLRKN